ncbi:MAG TPA: PAS domain S-box protein [Smithellaceae bacterium]|nr:PAS domain S-box protein [Smithellaceae bacterium]
MIDKAMAKEQVSELVEILRYNAESENFYHTVFETIGIAILILDQNNTILRANGEFERLTGYTREEVECKRKWTEVTARKDDLERMKEYNRLRHINPLSAPRTYGFQFVDRQGQAKDVVLTVAVMPGTKKSLAVMMDVTEQKRMEAALQESEQRLADTIDFLPDATFAVDLSGKVIAWNRAIEEMTGVKAAEILGKGDYEYTRAFYSMRRPMLIDLVFNPDADIKTIYDFVTREEKVFLAETHITLRGVDRALWGKAGPLYNSSGAVVGAIETVRDITDRRRTEVALQKAHDELEARVRERTVELVQVNRVLQAEIAERKRAEEKMLILANLSDISPLSITVHDLEGNFLYANQKTFDMHGYSKEEFLALNVCELDLPASAALFEEHLKEILETGEAKFDVEHHRKDGACLPLEVFVKATRWENQTVLLSVASDVTERRRNEEELKKYRKDLEVLVAERTAELEDKTKNLQEMNTALNVLLQKREKDKEILEENFVANIGSLVLPYVEKLRKNNLDMQQQFCLDIIEKHLGEIASPLLNNIRRYDLTPREIQIASLIKDGKTTKEISKTLGIGEGSIDTHRKNIRKKLGLDRASNLQSHLRFLEKNR